MPFTATPEAREITPQPSPSPYRFFVTLTLGAEWMVHDAEGVYTPQRAFSIKRNADYFAQGLAAYEAGDVDEASKLMRWAVNGERY